MDLDFKAFVEGSVVGLNAPGRAGQHFWKPETPITNVNPKKPDLSAEKKMKSIDLKNGFKPLHPAPFRGITADQFGIVVKKIPKPHI